MPRGLNLWAQLLTFSHFFDRGFRIGLLILRKLVQKNALLNDKKILRSGFWPDFSGPVADSTAVTVEICPREQ
jgi:hypothetical protein